MFKLLFKENDDFDYYILGKNIRFYGILGAVMHLVFFAILKYGLGLKEILGLRLLMSGLHLPLVFYKPNKWSLLQKRYFDLALIITLPIFFGYMNFVNGVDVVWSVSYLFSMFVFISFARLRVVIAAQFITLILGVILSIGVFELSLEQNQTYIGIYILTWLLLIILAVAKRLFVDEVQQNRSLRESVGNQNELLSSLIYISGELSMYDTIEAVFEVLVDRFGALMPNYSVGLYLSTDKNNKILRSETNGLSEEDLIYIRTHFAKLSRTSSSMIADNFIVKPCWHVFNKGYSILNHSGDIEYNLMMVLVGEQIKDYQIGFIQIFMEQISGNIRMREQTKQLDLFSKTDQLTRMYNRNAYNQEMQYLVRKYQEEHPFSIIFGDVNGLKYINDTYGHTDGDMLLKRCSEIIHEVLDSDRKLFRYGGDEVVIILEDTGLEEAMKVESQLETAFLEEELLCTNEVTGEQVLEKVAMSFGTICSREGSFDELIDLADVRMRKNKDAYYMQQKKGRYR